MMKSGALRTTCVWSIALCVGVVSTLAWSGLGRADSHGHGGHGHGHSHAGGFVWHVLKAKEALGLSDEQETKLRAIGVNATKDRVKKEAEVELAEIDLHQLFHEQDKQESAGDIEGGDQETLCAQGRSAHCLVQSASERSGCLDTGATEKTARAP